MKKFSAVFSLLFLFILSTQITSCTQDKCKGVTCQNGGTCSNGNCNCVTGYEGANCQTKANAKFVGNYTGTSNCDGSVSSETVPIEAGIDAASIKIYINSVHTLNATINGNAISIPVQNFPSGSENYRYSGSGTLSGNAITLSVSVLYSSVDPDYAYQCVYTLSK